MLLTVIESLFTTSQIDNRTYRSTLTHLASEFITEIEHIFGPRDPSFTYLGIEMDATPGAIPMNWFPDAGKPLSDPDHPTRHVLIRLTENALNNANIAKWQLAHECVHLLDPWNEEQE